MSCSGDLIYEIPLIQSVMSFLTQPRGNLINPPANYTQQEAAGGAAGMGQTPSLGASAVSPFVGPPYVITVDELVAHWIGRDEELLQEEEQHGGQRHRQHPAPEEDSSSQGSTGTRAEATTALTAHHHAEAAPPPSVALVTVRRRDGVEVLVSRQIAYGGRVRLPPLLDEEEVTVAFSDGSIVRLPACAVHAQAGMGEALHLLEEQEPQNSSLSRSRRRSSSQCHQLVYRIERPPGGGALVPYDDAATAAQLPLRLAGEREVQLAVVLVNMACHHHDLTGVTLLLLGLILFAEAWKRHVVEGQQGRQALQAAAVGLELMAERCMARRRSSVVEMAARGRALTLSTTTMTTTTTVTTTMTTVVVKEEGQQGVASFAVTERRRSTRSVSSSSSSSVALMATLQPQEEIPPLPQRYLLVCGQDPVRAAAMWAATLRWRAEYGVDAILERPHTKFHLIKQCFPQFLAGQSKSGHPGACVSRMGWMSLLITHQSPFFTNTQPTHACIAPRTNPLHSPTPTPHACIPQTKTVYYEQTGRIDQAALRAAGVSVDEMLHAYVYLNEFLYTRCVSHALWDVGFDSRGGRIVTLSPEFKHALSINLSHNIQAGHGRGGAGRDGGGRGGPEHGQHVPAVHRVRNQGVRAHPVALPRAGTGK